MNLHQDSIDEQGISYGDAKAASQLLEERLRQVWRLLKLSADKNNCTAETVHQLRVATRRAQVAVKFLLGPLAPRKAARMSKDLRKIRVACNDTRDIDVQIERLMGLTKTNPELNQKSVIEVLVEQRLGAQKKIRKALQRARINDFKSRIGKRVKKLYSAGSHWQGAGEFLSLLSENLVKLENHGRADLNQEKKLHEFRIQVKKARYAIELLAQWQKTLSLDVVLNDLKEIQDRLGIINDHQTARDQYRGFLRDSTDPLLCEELFRLVEIESEQHQKLVNAFVSTWQPEQMTSIARRPFLDHMQ